MLISNILRSICFVLFPAVLPIISHVARHTFATLCMTSGVPIESISKMLGHTNIRTTQTYARIIDRKLCDDMASLAEKLEENKKTSEFDQLFDNLSSDEKMALFNLPPIFSNDPTGIKRVAMMWHCLSDEEKSSLLSNTFIKKENMPFQSKNRNLKLAVNQ